MAPFSAAGHQRRVYDDARKPRGKRRPPLEGAQAGERLAQSLLEDILGVFLVVEQHECNSIELACVRGKEPLLGISIPSDGLLDDGPLFAPVPPSGRGIQVKRRGGR